MKKSFSYKGSLKKNLIIGYLIFLLIVGTWFRVEGIFSNSFAFTYDVGRDLLEVNKIVNNHTIPLIGQTTGLGGLFYGPWWYYILTFPFALSRGNPQGIALFIAITGITVFVIGIFLGKKISDTYLGIILGSLLALSASMVGLSSQIWNPNIAPILLIISFLLIYKIFKENSLSGKAETFILGLVLGFLLDAEIVFGSLYLVSVIITIFVFLRKKLFSNKLIYLILGFITTLLPRIVFELRHHFIMTNTLLHTSNNSPVKFDLLSSVENVSQLFFNTFTDSFIRGSVGMMVGWAIIIITIVAYILYFKKASFLEKRFTFFNLIVFLVFFIILCLYPGNVYGHFIIGFPLFYIFFVSVGFNLLRREWKFRGLSILAFVLLCVFMVNPGERISALNKPLFEGNAAVYRNQLAVIDYIYKDANGKKFNYIAYTPAVIDYTYQYLMIWYGKNKYGYQPSISTQKLFYVILEPDPEIPARQTEWLKIREGDGKVITDTIVKGGIRVQRRIRE